MGNDKSKIRLGKNYPVILQNYPELSRSNTMEQIRDINLEELDKYMEILLKTESGVIEFPKIVLRDKRAQEIFDRYAYRPDFVNRDDLILLKQINEQNFLDLRGHLQIVFWSSPLYMLMMAHDADFLSSLKKGLAEVGLHQVNLVEAISSLDISNNEKTMVREVFEYLISKFGPEIEV